MPPSLAQDSWIADTFGVNPASFMFPGQAVTGATAPATGKAPQHAEDWAHKAPAFGRAAKLWAQAIAATEKDLHKIREEIVATFEGDEEGLRLEKDFIAELDRCLGTLDLTLHDELLHLAEAPSGSTDDPAGAARKLMDGHIAYLKTDQFMKTVDDNPFEIKIVERLTTSLSAIKGVLA